MVKYGVLFLTIFLSVFSHAGAAVIEGIHREYAGEKLMFYTYADPVSQQRTPVFSIEPGKDGSFRTEISVDQPLFAFCDFGIYRGLLVLEPQKSIRLKLPPLRKRSFADQKNPYFKPVDFWFATESGDQLNDRIQAFDMLLNRLTDRYFNQLYFNRSSSIMDSVRSALESQFGSDGPEPFEVHKRLKIEALEADALRLSTKQIALTLQDIPMRYYNFPAFIELLEKAFTNQLSFDAKMEDGSKFRRALAMADKAFFISHLKEAYGLKEPMTALALLKMFHDGFYSGDFQQEHIIKMIASDYFTGHVNPRIRAAASQVKSKLQFLRKDSPAPVICLKSTNGHPYCSDGSSEGDSQKLKYLVFADTEMVVCQEHLKYLSAIEEKFGDYLEVIVILRKTGLIPMKMFLDKEKIPGIHLIDEENHFIDLYQVKSFPSCFLLTPKHRVAFTQVKAPLDGFEQQFAPFLRQHLFEKQRNQGR